MARKWKHSDFSDSDSIELATLLTTPFFDFHKVISALMTPTMTMTMTLTLSLMKTSLEENHMTL